MSKHLRHLIVLLLLAAGIATASAEVSDDMVSLLRQQYANRRA